MDAPTKKKLARLMICRKIVSLIIIASLIWGSGGAPVLAAYARMLSPGSGSTVRGTVEVSVGFISDSKHKATRAQLLVDGEDYGSKILDAAQERGVVSILWDSTRYADGDRGLSVFIFSGRNQIGKAYARVTVENASAIKSVPGSKLNKGAIRIKFNNLRDGERIKGSRTVNVLPDKTLGAKVYISLYVDKQLKFISNRNPFDFTLDTSNLTDGSHQVEAEVRDESQNLLASHAIQISVENKGTLAETIAKMTADVPQTKEISAVPDFSIAALPESKIAQAGSNAARALDTSSLYKKTNGQLKSSNSSTPVPSQHAPDSNTQSESPKLFVGLKTNSKRPTITTKAPKATNKPAYNSKPSAVVKAQTKSEVILAAPETSSAVVKTLIKPLMQWEDIPMKTDESSPATRPKSVPTVPKKLHIQPLPAPVSPAKPIPPMPAPERIAKIPDSLKHMPDLDIKSEVPDVVAVTATTSNRSMPDVAKLEPMASPAANKKLEKPETQWHEISSRPSTAFILSKPHTRPLSASTSEEPRTSKALTRLAQSTKLARTALRIPTIPKPPVPKAAPMLSMPEISDIRFMRYTENDPKIYEGGAIVQLRRAVQTLGGNVQWNNKSKIATATLQGRKLVADLRRNSLMAYSSKGKTTLTGLRVSLKNGYTMISATALAKGLNFRVTWDKETRSVKFERKIHSIKTIANGT